MLVDVHVHLLYHFEQEKRDILKAMELYGIDKIYVSSLQSLAPDPDEVRLLNRETEKFIREQPDRVGGYVYLNPANPDALEVLKRGIEEQGMSGIKLWMSTYCDAECVDPVVEKAEEYNVPVLLHCFKKAIGQYDNETLGENVAHLARRHPRAKLIMAHLGGDCYDGIPAIRNCPNVWTDLSGSIIRADDLRYTVKYLGADRVLFGTDMPGICLGCIGQILEGLDEEAREKVAWRNALRVFDRNYR